MSLDRYERSAYFKSSGKRLRCPFCGERMDFYDPLDYYESSSAWTWNCRECGLEVGNLLSFPEELVSRIRRNYLKALKNIYERRAKEAEAAHVKIGKWGKHMSPKEKVRLLAEKLEIEESDVKG